MQEILETTEITVRSVKELLEENAMATRAEWGIPTLKIPSIENDTEMRIRYNVLQRALLMSSESLSSLSGVQEEMSDSKTQRTLEENNKEEELQEQSREILLLEEEKTTKMKEKRIVEEDGGVPSKNTANTTNDNNNIKSNTAASVSHALIAIAETSKRTRETNEELHESESDNSKYDDSIISSHPSMLRARHELVLRQSTLNFDSSSSTATTTSNNNNNNSNKNTDRTSTALVTYTNINNKANNNAASPAQYVAPPQWKLSKVLVGHQGWVWTVAVDPTNSWFASGAGDGIIKIWDLTSGMLKMNLTGHKEAVRTLALSTLSPYMFSGSDDHAIKCWDLERNEMIRDFFGHKSAVHCLALHPKLDIVVSGGRDRTVRVWDIRTRAAIHTFVGHSDSVMSLLSQQREPQVVSGGSDGFIYLWDLIAGKAQQRLTRHKRPVRGLCLSVAQESLISCGADDIRIWQMPHGEYVCHASTIVSTLGVANKSTEQHSNNTTNNNNTNNKSEMIEMGYRWSCCAMSRRGVLAVGSQDGQLALYDWDQPQPIISYQQPIALQNNREHQQQQQQEEVIRRYAPYQFTKTKSIPGTLPGEGGINALTFDVSGTRLITAESDKSLKIWRTRE